MPSLFIRKLISSKNFFCNALRNLAKAKPLKLAPRDTRVAVGERGVISKLGTNVFGLLFLFVFSTSVQASCEYVLTNYNGPYSWSAEITVTNTGNTDVIGWDVSWSYPDTSTPYHPSGYSFSNSNSVYTAEAPSYNSGIYTLSPGEVAVVSFSGGGNGSGVADSVTGDICGPAVISESLTIVKEVINDNGGTAVVADFGITTDAGALTFDAGTTSGDTTTYTSTELTINEGTFSLSELDVTDYDEGTWSCSGASGAVVSTFNAGSVEVAVGEHVTCTITNDDTIPVITPPSEYTKGVCSIDPATQFWQRGVEYNSNNGGDPTLATGINTDVFSRAESFSAGPGISFTAANTAILITGADQATYTEAYEAGDYLEYTVETIASLPDTAVISGFSENGGRDGTAPYQMDMIVSDDNFATGVRLFSGYTVDDNIPADSTSTFSWITDNLQQIYLEAGTEYKFRVVFYGATPNNTNIMMDDFAISVDNCTDRGDAPYEVDDENQGGHYLPLVREHYLGTVAPDAEFYVPGDDNTDGETTTDEENGVTLPSNFNVGQSATITASVIGSGGLLNAWIDWDGNEVFDADEKITTDTALAGGGSSGTITLNLTVPSDAVVGTSYARFRWSPNSVANATDFVAEGEMEDYEVTIVDEPVVVETVVTSVTPTTIVSVDVTPEATYCSALQVQRGVHLFTVPAGVTEMNFKGWGAGGHSDFNNQTSGPGGYTEANIPVTPGDQYTIIVGGRGGFAGGTNGHGFGGEGSTAGSGGGLTGLFTGSTAVSSDEQSRAILISGGGGGSDRTIFLASSTYTTQNQLGGSGGDTVNGGGQNTMKGADGSSGVGGVDGTFPRAAGGGGGGYAGGSLHQRFGNTEGLAGNGGTSYINSGLIVAGSDTNLFTPEFDYIPPNITDVHYVSPFGEGEPGAGAGNDGLVVIQYNDGTCDDPILTIEKTVIKDNAGTATDTDWTLTATDGTTTISGVEGDAAITTATVAAGTYTLSESGPSGYEQTSLSCTGAVDTDLTDGLSLVAGETVTCTFTNDDLEVDALVRPTQCGAWNHKGWITYGYPDLHDSEVVFNSGDATNDPYLYLQLSRDADGRVLSYFGATDESTSGVLPNRPGSDLTSTANNAVDHESEYHTTVYRLEGVAGTSESISLTSVGGFEWTSYWTENTAGTVLESLEFEPTWGTDIGTGEILSVPVTYPADGIVYLYVSQFDPSAAYGRPGIDGYSCPVSLTPEVTVTKSAGATGTLQADGTFTQAFTITLESTGDAAVTAPSLVDNLEVLFGDMYTPSTDAVTTSGVSIAPVVTADAGNTGVAPAANANFDGDTSDDLLDGTGSLEAGDSISVTFTVVLDAAETPASGTEVNAVTATATPPTGSVLVVVGTDEGGAPTSDGSAGATITPPTDSGAIGVVKTAVVDLTTAGGAATLDAGDTINYTYVVTNTSTSLNAYNVTVSETASFTGTGTAPSPAYASGGSNLDAGTSTDDLAPAETLTWTASYVLTQDDIEAGKVDNQAKADATDSLNNALTDLSDEADATVGSDDATSTPLTQVSSLSIVKADPSLKTDADTSSDITLGDTLEYVVTVTNDGNVTQNNVVVSDAQLTLSSTTCVTLAPGATCVLTGEHVVTLAEADAGEVVNTAGVISDELPTSEASNVVTTPVITDADLTVLKSAATLATDADTSGDITFGDTLEYTVTVTNEGTATQNNVVVTDAQLTPNSFACATLAPAATCVLTGTHVVTLAEADAGKVVNTAAAESDEVTTPVSSNTITTPVITEAELTILKSAATLATDADTSGDITFGDTLEYTVTVTNEGTAPQNNVVVTDPQLTPNSFACATLAPAATCILTGTHEVTLAEADAGNVVNTAAAESDEVTTPVSSNTITTPVITEAELTVLKSAATLATDADTSGDITFGDTLEYTVTVTNEGTATQNNVVVTDPQLTPSSFTCATLAPAATCVLTGTHEVTLAEADAGNVVNTAAAESDEVTTPVSSNTITTPVITEAELTVLKSAPTLATDADTSGDITFGDTLEYTVTVTNEGTATQNNVVVTDAQLTPNSFACATLAPAATCVLTGTHVVTLAEADAGKVVNTAAAESDEVTTPVSSNTITTPVITEAELTVLKSAATLATDADTSGDITFGDTLEYTVTVTNEGTATQNNVVVTDPQLTPSSFTCATLAPAATCVLTGTHEVTLAEADAGNVVNTAAAESDEVTTPVSSNTITTPVITEAELTVLKSAATLATDADTSGDITLGDTLEYTVTVTNEGTATQNNVVVTDAQLTPSSFTCATLAPAATCVLTGTHVVTLAEADAGKVVNTAAAESDEVTTSVASNTITTPVLTDPSLDIVKAAATISIDADSSMDVTLGDTLEYVITATNDGNETLTNVVVSDAQLTPNSTNCATLAPTETCVLTGTHEVTLAEADAGQVVNTAGVVSDEIPTSVPSNTVTTPVEGEPLLTILKSAATLATDADTSGDITLGDTLEYTITATNTGNTTVGNVVVSDVKLTPSTITCATLAPNATCVLTGTHEVTLAEVDAGLVVNTADVTSDVPPTSETSNTVNTPIETDPSLSIVKAAATLATDADSSGDVTLGDTLSYTITATNDGNATQSNVIVSDAQLTPNSMTCVTLAPGATCVLTGTHDVTLAEADAGTVDNTAGVISDEVPTSVSSNTVNTPVLTDPSLEIIKAAATIATDADNSMDVTLGDTLQYVITVTNSGNATQNNVVVSDTQLTPSSFTCATLAPAATCVLTGTHEVTLVEADAGQVVNTAGVVSDEVPTSVPSNTVTTPVEDDPLLEIVKSAATLSTDADSSGDVTLGDTLEYTITATNTGNSTITDVDVTDAQLTPSTINCPTLAPSASCVLTGTHVVTLAEVDAGVVVNTANVVSDVPPTNETSNTVNTPVLSDPSLDIVKAAATLATDADSSGDITLGDTVSYTITVTNDGNSTQNNVVVSDTQLTPSSFACATLAPNATCVLTGTHEITLAEVDAGVVVNTAAVVSDELPTSESSNTVTTPVLADPSLALVKADATLSTDADSSMDITLGDTIEYVITATNDGNETLTNVVISDAQLTPSSMTCATLSPGATCVLTGTHEITLAEADAGQVVNTAGVVSDETPTSVPSNTVTTPIEEDPLLTIVKATPILATDADSSGDITLGDTLEYTITVTNTGNSTVSDVDVTDPQLTPSAINCPTLAPAATCVLTGTACCDVG